MPLLYYSRQEGPKVMLVGMLHAGEKPFYQRVNNILQKRDAVIYEEPFVRDAETMQHLDEEWRPLLEGTNEDDAFVAAIRMPMPPQKFMRDQGWIEQVRCFDYSQEHWISGDGAWGRGKADVRLTEQTWQQIYERIRTVEKKIRDEKIRAAKFFLHKVDVESATVRDYISFRQLYEKEIEQMVNHPTLVYSRDDMALEVFDEAIRTRSPRYVGMIFGNGHVPHMDKLLRVRGFQLKTVQWLRILTITSHE
ncbi:MAG: hypothetical protein AAB539_03855 [Patescibacteria group bacterium]